MKKRRVRETVIVDCVINADGRPLDVKTTRFKDPDAAEAAEKAVAAYRFRPATLGGKPVAWFTQIVVPFWFY